MVFVRVLTLPYHSAGPTLRTEKDIGSENPETTTVSVHKDAFSYERLVATSVMEAAAFSISVVDSWPRRFCDSRTKVEL